MADLNQNATLANLKQTVENMKLYIDSDKTASIKGYLKQNNTHKFYNTTTPTENTTPIFSFSIPEEMFLDQTKTTFVSNFTWSFDEYENSTNPNLDGKPVMVLAVKGETSVSYSFLNLEELLRKAYSTKTTNSLALEINESGEISGDVNISEDENNALIVKSDGLYVPTTSETEISKEVGNIIENKDDGIFVPKTDLTNYFKKDETYSRIEVDAAIARAQLEGEDVDLSAYATTEYVDGFVLDIETDLLGKADKEHSHAMSDITDYQAPDLSPYALKTELPSTEGLVTESNLNNTLNNYAQKSEIPEEYDDTDISNRVTVIEDDYLKASDKSELTTAIATAKQEAIEAVLGENVDADFDTLKEVADWIQADTTSSSELVTRVTNAENDIDSIENKLKYNKSTYVNSYSSGTINSSRVTDTTEHNDILYGHDNTLKNIITQITTMNNLASPTSSGMMSRSDKEKLDGIEAGANNYVHPDDSGNKHIPSGGSSGQILKWGNEDGIAVWGDESVTTVTTTGNGNAITSISASNGAITATKGSTFLTSHPTISKSSDSTSSVSPMHGYTFTAVDSVTRDSNGHVTKINTKTVTLPSTSSFMYKTNPTGTGSFSINGIAGGTNSVALGEDTVASGRASFVEGYNNKAFDNYSHVEGMYNNKVSSFVKMDMSSATGSCGEVNTDNMIYDGVSYAKSTTFTLGMSISPSKTSETGYYKGRIALSNGSTVSDLLIYYTGNTNISIYSTSYSLMNFASTNATLYLEEAEIPPSTESTHIQGKYALINGNYAHVVGNGTSDTERSNAHTLDWDGNAVFAGDVKATDSSGNTVSLLDLCENSGSGGSYYIGTCSTTGSTAKKTVTISGFKLNVGVEVRVKFAATNTSSSATLNISSTGDIPMYYNDDTRVYYIPQEIYHSFIYDGTYWRYNGALNTLLSNRSNERYGVKMNGTALVPVTSGYNTSLGTTNSKFGTIYANNIGSDSYPSNSIYGDCIYANLLFTKSGNYRTKVLTPLPLLYGHFTITNNHRLVLNNTICSQYAKSLYIGYLNTNPDVNSSGYATATSPQGSIYDVAFLFRVIGYDSSSTKAAIPFVHEFALTTAYLTNNCAEQSTDWYLFKTPCNNEVYFYITGVSIDECGYVTGTPTLNIYTTSSNVHFSEIALMP